MAPMTRTQRRASHATHRRSEKYRERLQRALEAMARARIDVGRPETLAAEVQWRLQRVGKLLGKIFGLMFPPVFSCRTYHALTRVRNGDKNLPAHILGAIPQQQWRRQVPHRGPDLLATRWRPVEDTSPATRSRWPWTWGGDDSVFKKSGQHLGLGGTG